MGTKKNTVLTLYGETGTPAALVATHYASLASLAEAGRVEQANKVAGQAVKDALAALVAAGEGGYANTPAIITAADLVLGEAPELSGIA